MSRVFNCSSCGRMVKSDNDLSARACSKCGEKTVEELVPAVKQNKVLREPAGVVSQKTMPLKEPKVPGVTLEPTLEDYEKEEKKVVTYSEKEHYLQGFQDGVKHGFDSGFVTGRDAEQAKMAVLMPDENEYDEEQDEDEELADE